MKILSNLFLVCFKIGLFTFGGGYAMLALIEDICVEKKKWITHEEMMDITVIAELRSIPGMVQRRLISPSYLATISLTQVSTLVISFSMKS